MSKSLTGGSASSRLPEVRGLQQARSELARAVQRRAYACAAAPCSSSGTRRDLARASRQRATDRQPRDRGRAGGSARSSGKVWRRLRRRIWQREATFAVSPWPRSTVSSDRADEGGVSRDLHAAPSGQGVASSTGASRLRSRRSTFSATRAPASRQILAAVLSKGRTLNWGVVGGQ